MERIRFTKPVQFVGGADYHDTPKRLNDCRIDKETFELRSVNASRSVNTSTEFAIGEKPNVVWNKRLLDGTGEDLRCAASFNAYLYGSEADAGLTVYPPNYNGSNADSVGPLITSVTSSLKDETTTRDALEDSGVPGIVGYLFIPYSARDEAGPWVYHSATFNFVRGTSERTEEDVASKFSFWYKKPTTTFLLAANEVTTSYVEMYRTVSHVAQHGFDTESTYYYMGRFQVDGVDTSGFVNIVDDKIWQKVGFARTMQKIYAQADTESSARYTKWTIGPEKLLELGVFGAERLVMPATTLSRSLNALCQYPSTAAATAPYAATFDAWEDIGTARTSDSRAYQTSPQVFKAETVANVSDVLVYGNVTYSLKHPALVGWIGKATGGATLKMCYEYRLNDGTIKYGPLLTVSNVDKVAVAWQGEHALVIMDASDDLIERMVPDQFGRYASVTQVNITTSVTDLVWNEDEDAMVSSTTEHEAIVGRSYWSYDSDGTLATPVNIGAISATAAVQETNVALLSDQFRPWEVTWEQFYIRDNSAILGIMNSRIAEEESLLSYDGYVFSEDAIYWMNLDPQTRRVRTDFISNVVAAKTTSFTDSTLVAELVPGGVVFASTANQLWSLSGRQIRRMDNLLEGLWTTIYDISYHQTDEDLYILTDTGIWVWSLNVFGGIYKHFSYTVTGGQKACMVYLKDTITTVGPGTPDVAYDGVFVYETGGTPTFQEVGAGTTRATNPYVDTHRIESPGYPMKMTMLRFDAPLSPRAGVAGLTGGTLTIDATHATFATTEDEGIQLRIQDGLVGGTTATVTVDVTSTTTADVALVGAGELATGITGKKILWPVFDVTHTRNMRESEANTYPLTPGITYYPKGAGYVHELRIAKFWGLRSVTFEPREM